MKDHQKLETLSCRNSENSQRGTVYAVVILWLFFSLQWSRTGKHFNWRSAREYDLQGAPAALFPREGGV